MANVSVIVPCFNNAKYVREALSSVVEQSVHVFEIIFVDDGSTDGSAEIAASVSPRIRIITRPNGGIGAARNTGMENASGELIAFLDADDIWPERSLEARLTHLTEGRYDCVFGRLENFVSPELAADKAAALSFPTGEHQARFASSMLVTADLMRKVDGFDETLRVGEMFDLLGRFEAECVKTGFVDALCLRRRIHGSNTTLRHQASRRDYLRALKKVADAKAAGKRSAS